MIETLTLPDPDDRHVLAAAIRAKAKWILTLNLRDFPDSALAQHDIEAIAPDEFVFRILQQNPGKVLAVIKKLRQRLKRPPKSAEEYIETLRHQGLSKTVAFLEKFKTEI